VTKCHRRRLVWVACFGLLSAVTAASWAAEAKPQLMPFLEQKTALFSSPWVTTGGLGGGLGVQALWRRRYSAELQADLLWALGNVLLLQSSVGFQRDGYYQPGVRLTYSVLIGDRLEALYDDGRRPARPSWAIGPRLVPLRFGSDRAFASALEMGLGTDFARGLLFEVALLKAGGTW
jgi:hypothetical protein